ncbi:MAG: acyl-CoA dehydrogenase family protein [Candidatus Binatia bacterium]
MTSTDREASGLAEAARALVPRVRALADETERQRRLPAELVAAFARAGIFRMAVPRRFGGGEVAASILIAALEELSRADGSAGWCAMIGATSGVIAAYLPDETANEIYARDPEVVTGGVFAPHGRALVVDEGYRISGRWPFASGCQHCEWLMAGVVVVEDGKPRLLANGQPDSRLMFFPRSAATIVDTWNVSGLRGTGSHDLEITDLVVPRTRSVSIITELPRERGPLYRFPVFGLLALGCAAVALGLARAAIDELVRLATEKVPTGSRRRLAERGAIQVQMAEAEALIGSARAFLYESVGTAWDEAAAGGDISLARRARLRLAATHAVVTSARVVDLMYNAGGGTAIYAASPLQRCFRDAHVVTQHIMVAPATLEVIGRLCFGLETDTAML